MRVKSWQTDQNEEDKKPMGKTGILSELPKYHNNEYYFKAEGWET